MSLTIRQRMGIFAGTSILLDMILRWLGANTGGQPGHFPGIIAWVLGMGVFVAFLDCSSPALAKSRGEAYLTYVWWAGVLAVFVGGAAALGG
jgi:hypothetical protein